jgi:hypothetical protein
MFMTVSIILFTLSLCLVTAGIVARAQRIATRRKRYEANVIANVGRYRRLRRGL